MTEKDEGLGRLWDNPYEFDEVKKQSQLVRLVMDRLDPQLDTLLNADEARKIEKIYCTGCGDSYFAAYAARLAFEKLSGVPMEPMEALEFSRYTVDFISPETWVFGISNSGQAKRSVEAARLARARSATTIAVTGNEQGPLAQESERILLQSVPELLEGVGPNNVVALGLGNFTASLLALYASAIRIGLLRGVLSEEEAQDCREEMIRSSEIIAETTEKNRECAQELAIDTWNLDTFVVVGGGPSYAVAMFTAAKLMEQPQKRGAPQFLEEWAHLDYFLVRPKITPTMFIVPPGRGRDRAIEQMHGARDMGATVIAVCDSQDEEIKELAHWALPVYGELPEEFSPLSYIVPGQLFATALHRIVGRKPFIPPYTEERMEEINYRQIWQGGILEA